MGIPAVVKKVQNTSCIDCDLRLNTAIWHALKLDSLTVGRSSAAKLVRAAVNASVPPRTFILPSAPFHRAYSGSTHV